jgi:NAD(P)-dependent dehydrogenase (short-subunit alcohol dehydrogenase family)
VASADRRPAAFVTGASYGIGAATAVALARDGLDVAVSELRPDELAATLGAIAAASGLAVPVALDLRSWASIARAHRPDEAHAGHRVGDHGIRVNAVAPGTVETPSRAAAFAANLGRRDFLMSRIPLRRFGTAEEMAAAVCYLASPRATYITGQTLFLDGGLTAC